MKRIWVVKDYLEGREFVTWETRSKKAVRPRIPSYGEGPRGRGAGREGQGHGEHRVALRPRCHYCEPVTHTKESEDLRSGCTHYTLGRLPPWGLGPICKGRQGVSWLGPGPSGCWCVRRTASRRGARPGPWQ